MLWKSMKHKNLEIAYMQIFQEVKNRECKWQQAINEKEITSSHFQHDGQAAKKIFICLHVAKWGWTEARSYIINILYYLGLHDTRRNISLSISHYLNFKIYSIKK
jgi:hypothetical protein